MKTIEQFLSELRSLKVKLWVEDDHLRYKAPKGALTASLRAELVARKAEVIQFISQAQRESSTQLTPIRPCSRDADNLPLSYAQQRLWFLDQLEGKNAIAYNMPMALRLDGRLHRTALEQSLQEIVQRHEILRTTFLMKAGEPVQVIHPLSVISDQLSVINLQTLPSEEQEPKVQQLIDEETQRPFDLSKGPLLRAMLLQQGVESHILLLTMHHVISDGWSMGVFINELATLYQAFSTSKPSPLPALPIQYADFAQWQRQWLTGKVLDTQLRYWQQQLADAPLVLEMPSDHSRPPVQTFQGGVEDFELTPALSKQLNDLSQQAGVSLFMTSLAAFAMLLGRYTGSDDIVIGSVIANRNRKEIEPLIGFFVNTLALRVDLSGNPTFLDLLTRVQQVTLGAYAHQELPFEQLVEALQPERDMSRNPLVQVILALQNAPQSSVELADLTLSEVAFDSNTVRFDLECHLWEFDGQLGGVMLYYKDLFDAATIKRMLAHFKTLLAAIAANPKLPLADYSLLNEAERHQLLVDWNNTSVDYPVDNCIHQLFEAQVEKTPEAIAVVFEEQSVTYQALNTKANQLAHYLQTLEVKADVLVGLCMERSIEMVIGLLGILKAGGAYVPLDASYPKERLAFMLADANVAVLLTQTSLVKQLPQTTAQVICLDTFFEDLSLQYGEANPVSEITSWNLAYVIYTSGSTGQPKGVQIIHHAATNFLQSMRQSPGLTNQDILLAVTTVSFDIAVLELYLPLIVGAKIVLVSREIAADGTQLLNPLNNAGITVMQATPATWRMLLAVGWKGNPALKILIGGEALPRELAHQLRQKGGCVWNLYGPTETTVWSTSYLVGTPQMKTLTFDTPEPIGRPIANTQIYILDRFLQPTPIGVIGELHIGGSGLARGYLNRPELTAEKFIRNPFCEEPNSRLYKTGDLARYRADGHIEYLGRIDNQVKLRGFRIELSEIEAVLTRHPWVREAVVTCYETQPFDKRLIAYPVSDQASELEVIEDSTQELKLEQISQWEHVWDENYSQSVIGSDITFNIAGWNSSYTGLPLPAAEMREWVDSTVNTILSWQPNQVLEMGCGTGLLLSRIAPSCRQYWGCDISPNALRQVERLKRTVDHLNHVELFNRKADDFSDIESDHFDLIILNSVIQYFPSITYLLEVLNQAVKAVKPGGYIFVGDVRSLPLLRAYHASVQLYQASASLSPLELQQRVQTRLMQEEELVIDPTFFVALTQHNPRLAGVTIRPKRGRHHNEMTRFRYDVILQVGDKIPAHREIRWQDWQPESSTLSNIRQQLVNNQAEVIGLRGVPNARLDTEMKTLEWFTNAAPTASVAQLRESLSKQKTTRIDPEDFWRLADELAYDVELSWANASYDGSYDVLFTPRVGLETGPGSFPQSPIPYPLFPNKPWHQYANNPLHSKQKRQLVPQLRQFLQERLPEYMVPSAFVMLDAIPLTPNGKVDLRALPSPDISVQVPAGNYVAPRTATEQSLVTIWRELLGLEKIGLHDNFFEIGGHSLLAVQLVYRVRETFSIELPLQYLFESPTVAGLAEHVKTVLQPRSSNQSKKRLEISILVPIQTKGSKRPLFCIVPAHGDIFAFEGVSKHLGDDQPFFVLQAPFIEKGPPLKTQELAARYLQEIRVIQTEGPYRLGGYCLGGILAFEMAQQLQAQGESVELLWLLDTSFYLPPSESAKVFYKPFRKHVLKTIPPTDENSSRRERIFNALFRDEGMRTHYYATLDYEPQPYPGRITFVQGEDSHLKEGGFPELWQQVAGGGLELMTFPGDHDSFVRPPNDQVLAHKLRASLEGCDSKS